MHYGLLPRSESRHFRHQRTAGPGQQGAGGLCSTSFKRGCPDQGLPRTPASRCPAGLLQIRRTTPRAERSYAAEDRIGSEFVTHYPLTADAIIAITTQEAWTTGLSAWAAQARADQGPGFHARSDRGNRFPGEPGLEVDRRSGVRARCRSPRSRTLGRMPSAALCAEPVVAPRVSDLRIAAGAHRKDRTGVRRRTQGR